MSNEIFEVTWEAEDGYVGSSRPHTFDVHISEVEDMTKEEIRDYLEERLRQEFEENVFACSEDEDDLIKWALENRAEDLKS